MGDCEKSSGKQPLIYSKSGLTAELFYKLYLFSLRDLMIYLKEDIN